jgi:thiamine-monophosphate kinase
MLAPHLWPEPRIPQGLWLRQHGAATAAIDISDGLSTDLDHLCAESGVSAEIDAQALPRFPGATWEDALHGGEDYELLFTAQPGAKVPRRIVNVAVSRIGTIVRKRTRQPSVVLVDPSGSHLLKPQGWEHFR